jgi:glycosyltransferase involved in cell wall biosynthesis
MSRVLVGLHRLDLGGSPLSALELATAVRDRGHEVEAFAPCAGEPGPVAGLLEERGIPLSVARHPLERPGRWPCRRSVAGALTRQARRMRADLLHVYEFPLILDAFYGPSRSLGIPLVGTVYAMAIPTWLPRSATLVAGTAELVAWARRVGQRATLIEPPVDTRSDDPARVDGAAFRRAHGIDRGEVVLGIVSRLEPEMKEEGVARAIAALREIGNSAGPRLRLVIAGDGPSREALARRAAAANAALGREAVLMVGALRDPRPAYAASDIALGMGGSALRAMAFAKPLIVLGVGGFSRPFEEATAGGFFERGLFGRGSGEPDPLAGQIAGLMDEDRRRRTGAWSRRVVLERYGLDTAADTLEAVFGEARRRSPRWLPAALHTTVQRTASELAGARARDRVRPVVHRALARRAAR